MYSVKIMDHHKYSPNDAIDELNGKSSELLEAFGSIQNFRIRLAANSSVSQTDMELLEYALASFQEIINELYYKSKFKYNYDDYKVLLYRYLILTMKHDLDMMEKTRSIFKISDDHVREEDFHRLIALSQIEDLCYRICTSNHEIQYLREMI